MMLSPETSVCLELSIYHTKHARSGCAGEQSMEAKFISFFPLSYLLETPFSYSQSEIENVSRTVVNTLQRYTITPYTINFTFHRFHCRLGAIATRVK